MWTPMSLNITFPDASVAPDFCSRSCNRRKKRKGGKRVKLYNFAATYLHCHYVHGTEVDRGQSDVNFSLLVLQLLQHKPHRIPYYLANAQGAAKTPNSPSRVNGTFIHIVSFCYCIHVWGKHMAILNIVKVAFILPQVLSRHRPAHLKEKHALQ